MNKVEKAVIRTIAFYQILNRPLKLDEIQFNLFQQQASKIQVLITIKNLVSKEIIEEKDNLYFLKGKEKMLTEYLSNRKINKDYWSRVDWIVKIIKYVPFLKNVSIINSLSYNGAKIESDIDILVISKKERFWTTRAFTVLFLEIIGQNKNKWYEAGKFCFGFGFDETRLNLSKIKLDKDIDFTYWLANLTPVYDRGIYKELIKSNPWLKDELPNWEEKYIKPDSQKLKFFEKILNGKFGEKLENWLAKIQIQRIWKDPKNHRKGASVVADKSMMKLHPYDERAKRQSDFEGLTRKLVKIK